VLVLFTESVKECSCVTVSRKKSLLGYFRVNRCKNFLAVIWGGLLRSVMRHLMSFSL
jgi:hypothetical protein